MLLTGRSGNGRIPNVRKIAVLRANAIGDFVFVLPALDSLRAAYPNAEIVLLGLPWHASFLAGRSGPIDRVVVVPHARGVGTSEDASEDPEELRRFFDAMQREEFDLAIQLHGGGRHSNPFVRRLGARHTAGLRASDAPALDRWIPYSYFQPEVVRYLEVVRLVGGESVGIEPRLSVEASDLQEAEQALPPDGKSRVVLHTGVGDHRRLWPPEKFAALGDCLAEIGVEVVLTGVKEDLERVEWIAGRMKRSAVNLCARLSLGGLVGLLSQAAVVVGNDSGPLHLAAALGAPTVGIYWCGNVITSAPLTRLRHRLAISWRLNCPQCGRNCIEDNCPHHVSFVADVSVEEVAGQVLEVLSPPAIPALDLQ